MVDRAAAVCGGDENHFEECDMSVRKCVAFVALGVGTALAPATSASRIDVDIRIGPPPPIVEVVP